MASLCFEVILLTMSSVKSLSEMSLRSTLHKFIDINGNPVYLPCVSYHLPETDVCLISLKHTNRCMVDTQKSIVIAHTCY